MDARLTRVFRKKVTTHVHVHAYTHKPHASRLARTRLKTPEERRALLQDRRFKVRDVVMMH